MVATLLLVGCVLTPGQSGDRAEWLLAPRLSRAMEFVYSGSFIEESTGDGIQFRRAYRLESRALVLDTSPKGAELALLTILKAREPEGRTITKVGTAPSSVRLEMVKLDGQGKLTAGQGVSLAVPLEGPPTLECGAFVEAPKRRIGIDHTWQTVEDSRPLRQWKVIGTELVDGVRCIKLLGVQQSEDWDQPRADHSAWRRRDTVWLDPVVGVAHRLERVIERRDPARQQPTHKSVLRYDLESNVQYPRQIFEDRRTEVQQAHIFADTLTPILPNPARHVSQLDALLAKISYHLEHEPPTPYREAVLQVKRRAEAAKRGDTPPQSPAETATPVTVAAPGRQAPDFLAPDFLSKDPARLRKWIGRPIMLVFYNPSSEAARDVLRFAERLNYTNRLQVTIVALAMSDEADLIRRQHEALQLSFPILNGIGLRQTYDVSSTPKIVIIDSTGIVRGAFTGWGSGTPDEVTEELQHWLPHGK